MSSTLDFEASLQPLERELEAVRRQANGQGPGGEREAQVGAALQERLREIYGRLTPWQKVQVARHRERPYTLDYVHRGFSDFVELRGDRSFADDRAMIGGPALLEGRTVMVIGHQKGRDTRENVERNFGMPHPEGYRKAERLMRQAERLRLPVVTFVDTPGANAGLTDEERGQAEAIASCIATMLGLRVPTASVVVGEGGSGGALGIAVADRILMLEHAIFTVASPEAAAAILWRDSGKAAEAAERMKITAQDLKRYGLVDHIVPEPTGGAHRDHAAAAAAVTAAIRETLADLERLPVEDLLERRYRKYREIAFYQ
ncbi:MAG: acetyl-CoA carboxylase carboxyltransferase subunit alpha [Chloroflexi bacterium]|nr:acetyl-CoA carboxylase carboxyltransferase subunit alpha [Chloroflexota bacterium]